MRVYILMWSPFCVYVVSAEDCDAGRVSVRVSPLAVPGGLAMATPPSSPLSEGSAARPPRLEPPLHPVNGIVQPPTVPPPERPGRLTNKLLILKSQIIKVRISLSLNILCTSAGVDIYRTLQMNIWKFIFCTGTLPLILNYMWKTYK